jgi:hypothetical protein
MKAGQNTTFCALASATSSGSSFAGLKCLLTAPNKLIPALISEFAQGLKSSNDAGFGALPVL